MSQGSAQSDTTPLAVKARGLGKTYGLLRALDPIDLDLRSGEALAVFGPNGAGKTTLLRLLCLAGRPSVGRLQLWGRDARKAHDLRASIGVLSHRLYLYDDLTGLENLVFFGRLHGVDNPGARGEALLEQFGLAHRALDRVGTYSRGMQQRLSLARCLMHDPRLIFLDEPFTGLDPHGTESLGAALARLRERSRTLVLTTHDLPQGLALADRFLILDGGRAVAEGNTDLDADAFASLYRDKVTGR